MKLGKNVLGKTFDPRRTLGVDVSTKKLLQNRLDLNYKYLNLWSKWAQQDDP